MICFLSCQAAEQGNTDMVRYLLDHGVSRSVRDKMGRTALDEARVNNDVDIVQLLSRVTTQV